MARAEIEISVILPSYKEAENLETIIPKLVNCLNDIGKKFEIIVVDTMYEMDNSKKVCLKNNIKYINRKNGNNYGDAIRTGIYEANGLYSVFMDADGSHNPSDIKRLYDEINETNCDIVIGSRYCKGGKTNNSFILIAMSRILNLVYKIVFNLKVDDISNSFRIYRSTQIKKLKLECENFDIIEEILIKMNNNCVNIVEIPICFNKRESGESKRNLVKFIFSYLSTMYRLIKIKYENH